MNDIIKNIKERRSIRHFKKDQINEKKLEQILEAGLWSPSAGGRQSTLLLVCQNPEVNEKNWTH